MSVPRSSSAEITAATVTIVGPLVGLERLQRLARGLVLRLGPGGACLALRRKLGAAVARALLALAPLGALSLS